MSLRILLATDVRFWRRSIGSQVRIAALLAHFSSCGHEVHVLFTAVPTPEDEDALAKERDAVIHCFRVCSDPLPKRSLSGRRFFSNSRRFIAQIIDSARRVSSEGPSCLQGVKFRYAMMEPKLRHFRRSDAKVELNRLMGELRPSVIIIEYVRLAYLLEDVPLNGRVLKIVDTHDVQFSRQRRFHSEGYIHDIDITAQEEAEALRAADVVLAIQDTDAELLMRMNPGSKVVTVAHPYPIERIRRTNSESNAVRVVFVGSAMDPNVDAARYIINYIWPEIERKYRSNAELHLFGAVCDAVRSSASMQVFIHGFVDDVRDAWAMADIAFNPIRLGGGLKIKNVEALSCGCPLLTTSVGAEGLEAGAGQAFYVADSAQEQLDFLCRLIDNPDLRHTLASGAIHFATEKFSETQVFRELDSILLSYEDRRLAT